MPSETSDARLSSNPALRRYGDVRELIASPENPTPLVRLNSVRPHGQFEIHLKLEWYNPFGSIKDRTALWLLNGMIERGELDGKDIVEPSSGNTGIAIAALAVLMGKKFVVTIPSGVPEEKKVILRMLGAEVWATPDDLCPVNHPKDGAIALARSFVEGAATKDRFAMPYQYENSDNVKAHYETTGPEIWQQTEGLVDYFFAGFGTCGTITGIGRYLKEQKPGVRVVAIEPQKGHRLPGLKNLEESKAPGILDRTVLDEVVRIDDGPAYAMTKRLFREEGLIVGPSTGALVEAAVRYGQDRAGVAVVISPDSGFKYSTFFADVLGDEGLPKA
jgi:cysteine synthase A/cysteine synthase B